MGMKWRHDNMLSISLGCPRHASPLRPLRPLHTCFGPSGRLLNSIIFIIKGGDAIFMPPLHIVFLELHFLNYLGLHLLVPRPRDGGGLLGVGGVLVPGAGVHLGVGGGEDDHVGHEDDHARAEHRHYDRQDDVQLSVLLRVVI